MQQTKYKHTDIGIIPEDWEIKTLGETCEFPTESIETSSFDIQFYITTDNLLQNCLGAIPYEGELTYKKVRAYKRGDVLVSNIRPNLRKTYIALQEGGCSTDIIVLRPTTVINSKILHLIVSTQNYANVISSAAVGTKMPRGDKAVIQSYTFALPPLFEQQRIAAALSDMDELITSIDKLIQKKQLIKQGAMQQLLTAKKRIKGFNQPWEEKRLGEIITTSSGGTPSRTIPEYYYGKIKWFTTSELNDCPLYDSDEHITEEALTCSSAKVFPAGTLLMAMYGATIGKLGTLTEPAATNQACCAIFSNKIDLTFLFYLLLLNRNTIVEKGCGAGQPNISQTIIKDLRFCIPPSLAEQRAIAQILTDMDNEVEALRQKKAKTEALKQAMMQQLLTGKIRLTSN